jgi:hypothetical protein
MNERELFRQYVNAHGFSRYSSEFATRTLRRTSGAGALAAAQLPALRAAAEKEAVPVIKRTLDAAIAAIVAAGGKPARD